MFEEVIYAACHSLYTVALLLWPVMPKKMKQLLASIGYTFKQNFNYDSELRENAFAKTYTLSKLDEPLFVRPEPRTITETASPVATTVQQGASAPIASAAALPSITIDDFTKIQLLVGTVTSCEPVAGSEKLYKLQVDLGLHGLRQILAGIAQYFKPADLVSKQGIYVANLASRKMMGLESHGMMLFAKDDKGNMRMLTVGGPVENGTRVS
jgi:methionyl-tRNA synthetase